MRVSGRGSAKRRRTMRRLIVLGRRTCTSSLYTSTYSQLEPEFGSSRLVCTLGLSLFVAGLGTGPMILSPLSEVRKIADMNTQVHMLMKCSSMGADLSIYAPSRFS
jgi:hypothetical protein